MSFDQHQHYLPQSYQRGWEGPDGLVYVYRWRHHRLTCKPRSTRSTGGRHGLYYVPMAPAEFRNDFEDRFWKTIDQWGADGLQILRRAVGPRPTDVQLGRLAIWLLSLELRNPRKLTELNDRAKMDAWDIIGRMGYDAFRSPHHPATLEEFQVALDQPGLTELGAQYLRELALNSKVRKRLSSMEWQVVSVTNSEPILTSDVPLIRYRGLEHDDGVWLLPLSSTEFLAIFNRGTIDMKRSIELNIRNRIFIEAMNKYVVSRKIDFVYAADDSQMAFVSSAWAASDVET